MKFDNLARADNFFPAFLHNEAICSLKIKVLSFSTSKSFCFLLSQIFVFPIFAEIFSYLNPETSK